MMEMNKEKKPENHRLEDKLWSDGKKMMRKQQIESRTIGSHYAWVGVFKIRRLMIMQ